MEDEYSEQISALLARYEHAEGPLMKFANYAGTKIESIMEKLPDGFEIEVQKVLKTALEKAYDTSDALSASSFTPIVPNYFHKVAATVSGAVGGVAGLPGAVVELPITITTMFSSFQKIAEGYGFDRTDPETKLECIKVFTMGGPLNSDQDVDLSFATARLGLSGQTVSSLISAASQKLAVMVTQKLGSQTVPIIGALTGATLNYTFISYYEEMAHIRFNLKKLKTEYESKDPLLDFIKLSEQNVPALD